jgi:prepilin-type N-terminal cleavage/methylation domain-containing protein/prepilin-type processing-associated H-X9-DG protein
MLLHRELRPRRNSSARNRGFTLAELLIVIAIIAVLISILLPTLGAARRAANSAKCLASLRDLGLAFQQYAQENKRAFPIVEYSPPTSYIVPTGFPTRRPWTDFLVKYIHKRDPDTTATVVDMGKYKTNSVLWGCPSYEADTFYQSQTDPGTSVQWLGANKWNTGYGMHRYAAAPYGGSFPAYTAGTPAAPGNHALIREGSGNYGQFYKMEKWGVRAAERGLIADSNTYDIVAAGNWVKSDPPGPDPGRRCDPFLGAVPAAKNYISVDGIRHIAPGSPPKKVMSSKGVNMLFVDGHAAGVTPDEAWIAIRGGGTDARSGQ